MNAPLSRFAPRCSRQRQQPFVAVQACAGRFGAAALSPSLDSLCESGGGRSQRGGAALARGRWHRACRFHGLARSAMDN